MYITLAGIISIGILFIFNSSLIILALYIPLLIFYEWGISKQNNEVVNN